MNTVLSIKDVRSMVYERDKIIISIQSEHCLVGESWGSTRRHYYITTVIPFIKYWTNIVSLYGESGWDVSF